MMMCSNALTIECRTWRQRFRFPTAFLVLLCLVLSACASPIKAPPPDERDPADPWEPYNRSMHEFNMRVDRAVLRPVAVGYTRVTPRPVQRGISNFFSNLGQPIVALNQLLQGEPRAAAETAGRFLINTTWGVAGVLDVASRGEMPRHQTDLGHTFATWGWTDSRYFVIPLLGPSTVRDTWGRLGDNFADRVAWYVYRETHYMLVALNIVQGRAAFLPQEDALQDAFDTYTLMRDAYLQRRAYRVGGEDAGLPDYDAYLDEGWDEDWDDD